MANHIDPFPNLGRRQLFADSPRPVVAVKKEQPEAKVKNIEELRQSVDEVTKKRGRPAGGKPWVEAGVSRSAWFRQRKTPSVLGTE